MSSKSQRDHNGCGSSCFHCSSPSIFAKKKIAPLLLKPCKGLSRLVSLPCRRPAVRFRERGGSVLGKTGCSCCWTRPSTSSIGWSFHRLSLSLCGSRQGEEMDKLGELPSMTDPERVRAPFPSPITPAYMKYLRLRQMRRREPGSIGGGSFDEVEEACRSFENYVVAMIVEEGKVRDLTDVEEFLCSWSSLKSPVFLDLVSSFYGELCNDLFSESERDDFD